MTRQQAGVSALTDMLEAHEYRYGGCSCGKFVLPSYSDSDLKKFEQSKPGSDIRWYFWMMHLQGALATAPPTHPLVGTRKPTPAEEAYGKTLIPLAEQALADERTCESSQLETEGEAGWQPVPFFSPSVQADLPQPVSAGALSDSFALIVKDLREAKATMNGKPVMEVSVGMNWMADRIETALAAHDQKVRAEVLEEAMLEEMAMYIALRLPEGLPLRGDRNEAKHVILRLMRAAAPAASKPEAGHE